MYKVMRKYDVRGSETPVGYYSNFAAAKNEITKLLAQDAQMKVKVIYCLYEGSDLLEQFDSLSHAESTSNSSGSSSQGQSSTQSFRPTPLPTAPRPTGMPASSWGRADDKESDEN